jgi:fumarate reductase flavoprotein subunit
MAEQSFPTSVDVIVVGGGLAGHSAALGAAQAGAEVVLLEKLPQTGGSTVLSGGFFALADTPLQRERGVKDSPDLLFEDMRKLGGEDTDEALLHVYAQEQRCFYDWLTDAGARFTALELSAGQSVPRSHRCDPSPLLEAMAEWLAATGRGRIIRAAEVHSLVREGEGRVSGVRVGAAGALRQMEARGGVVLTTGGFSRSEKLLRIFAPDQSSALRIGGAGCTGDGLRMAWRLGADFRDMGYIKGTFGTHPTTGTDRHKILLAFYFGAIAVNREGQRFVDESDSYKIMGDACLRQPGHEAFQMFDQQVMDRSDPGVPLFDFEPALADGTLIRANTLDELAKQIRVPVQALRETVKRYNEGVDSGVDPDFGRRSLCSGAGQMLRLEAAPFYAYPSTTIVLATYCGLVVSPSAAVKNVDGQVIEGLFAAGEIIGGFHGHSYMTGASLGKAAFFGRVAGREAASRAGHRGA